MEHERYSKEEIATRGRAIYEQQLRSLLEPANIGKYLVIDVDTSEYEIDEDGSAASLRAYRKRPEGARYGMRIGFLAWGRIGLGAATAQ